MQVLVWSAFGEERFGVGDNAQTVTAIYNGNTGAITEATVTNTKHDMFCSGISMLGNGDIVVTGAHCCGAVPCSCHSQRLRAGVHTCCGCMS
jgi:galactose oxidase